ncbi:MAG: LPS export ABC transporter periplasmic protein LptC [Marinicellaceae bacterium]
MSKQSQQIMMFFLLALISYSIWKIYFDHEKVATDKPFTKGYSVENVVLKITDETGVLSGEFKSPKLIRYTDSPIVYIEKPEMWTFDNGQQHWSIQSETAEYNSELLHVDLSENLIAKTVNGSGIRFNAENLFVDLNTKTAHTDAGIILKKELLSMTGQSAKFDLKNETIEVNNHVKAQYKTQK